MRTRRNSYRNLENKSIQDFLLICCNKVYEQDPIDIWNKGCIIPLPKKGDLSSTNNYRDITLTYIAAKIYNLMLLHRIRPTVDIILRKNQNGFRTNRSIYGKILTVRRIIEGANAKNLKKNQLTATILFLSTVGDPNWNWYRMS